MNAVSSTTASGNCSGSRLPAPSSSLARGDRFGEFEDVIRRLPTRERFEREDLLIPSLRLHQEQDLEIYYAPFDAVNTSAKVVLPGITPGWTQMELAFREALRQMDLGGSMEEACRSAKRKASFAGTMRTNLVRMLDDLGLADRLGIPSAAELFASSANLVHTTSVIRYPVFHRGRNYTGHSPHLLRTAALSAYVDSVLGPELASVPNAVIVPLGKAVSESLEYLADRKKLSRARCLFGFPHPSGANGTRLRDFNARRLELGEIIAKYLA